MFTAAILVFIFAWNDFLFAISLTSSDASRTVPAALAFFTGESQFTQPFANIAAAAVIVTDPDHHLRPDLPATHRRRASPPVRSRVRSKHQQEELTRMSEITLDKMTKRFPDGTEAVKELDLEIADGEFLILVGPSGCGKSTALRMIAGLEDISDGELRIGDDVVNGKAPKDRDIAMVFQNYALYPHMTVRENMEFPLKMAKIDQSKIDELVDNAAKILDLTEHLDRKPSNLSGGQRQRVAMGRAIVREPKAFLMDEPLSNLDAKLRVQMRAEVSRIQNRLETTTVYVTHDQTEAMTLGDRVAVMRKGELQQVGSPQELYDIPVNLFVAGFIGSPSMNFMPVEISGRHGEAAVRRGRPAGGDAGGRSTPIAGRTCWPGSGRSTSRTPRWSASRTGRRFEVEVELLESMGSELYIYFDIEHDKQLRSEQLDELAADTGAEVGGDEARARSSPGSTPRASAARGEKLELWMDADKPPLLRPRHAASGSAPTRAPARRGRSGSTRTSVRRRSGRRRRGAD